jgi:hypothetical protein
MYFDQYSITSLRYIDISFKNLLTVNLAVGLLYRQFQFQPVLFVQPVFHPFQSCFVTFPTSAVPVFFTLPFGWECKGKHLFQTSK